MLSTKLSPYILNSHFVGMYLMNPFPSGLLRTDWIVDSINHRNYGKFIYYNFIKIDIKRFSRKNHTLVCLASGFFFVVFVFVMSIFSYKQIYTIYKRI